MKKTINTILLVVTLLTLVTGIAIAAWEDTKDFQMMANVLPLPESGTFQFVSSPLGCQEVVIGYEGRCQFTILNESPTVMTLDAVTVTTSYPLVTITPEGNYGIGTTVEPGKVDHIGFYYLLDALGEPGTVTFDIEVTCSGD